VINAKSQGSVVTHLRFGGIFKLLSYYKLTAESVLKNLVNQSALDQILAIFLNKTIS